MAVQRRKFEFDEEKFIVVNLIMLTELCRDVLHVTNPDYFKSKGVKVLIGWMKEHYSRYNEALGAKVNEYYEINSATLDSSVREQVYNVLEHLSQRQDSEVHNIPYLRDRAFALYRKKFYENQIRAANSYIENGDVDKAEQALILRFDSGELTSLAKRIDDKELLNQCMEGLFRSEEKDVFFRFEGELGEFIPPLEQGWLVSFIAPPKTGKTVMLVETLITAIMQRKNVVFISFEMPLHQILNRLLKRITGMSTPAGGIYDVPIFDCLKNQDGTCNLSIRKGFDDLYDRSGKVPVLQKYDPKISWEPCVVCRGTERFKPTAWKAPIKKEAVTEATFRVQVNAFMRYYAKYCRSIFHPSKTTECRVLEAEIDALIHNENFVPDMIVIDYADLIKPSGGGGVKRLELDDVWESLRAMGQSRMSTVVTASQTSKAGVDAKYIKSVDIAEDFSKIAKLDIGIGLAQTEDMKTAGILNANLVASRHSEFTLAKTCSILQDLKAMQGHLDSCY